LTVNISFTSVLAAYGALVSTVAVLWNVFRDVTDRGKLRVHCYLGKIVTGSTIDPRTYLIYQVTNVGRRAAVVTNVGGRRTKQPGDEWLAFVIKPRNLPKTLQPGEYLMEYSPDLAGLTRVTKFEAYDSHGRYYRAPRADLREIRKRLPGLLPK
jgi:hypothetical protein